MNIKCTGKKLIVNLKTPIKSIKEMMHCPRCNSTDVYAYVFVTGRTYVNANTLEVSEPPDECDCGFDDIDDAEDFVCHACGKEWGR